jgi:hypothetical protein
VAALGAFNNDRPATNQDMQIVRIAFFTPETDLAERHLDYLGHRIKLPILINKCSVFLRRSFFVN